MPRGSGSPFAGAPKAVPGAPKSVPGAPHAIPGGPFKSGLVAGSRMGSGYSSFRTTVPDQATSGEFRDMHTRQIRDMQGRYSGDFGVAWQGLDLISKGLFEYGKSVEQAREAATEEIAKEMVEWAQANAPWDDDSTEARKGLQAHVVHQGARSIIWFGHGKHIHYGIWLEIMQNGKFAIVLPTVLRFSKQVGGRIAAHV